MRKMKTKVAWLLMCTLLCTSFGVDFTEVPKSVAAKEEQTAESTVDTTAEEASSEEDGVSNEDTDATDEDSISNEDTDAGDTNENAAIITVSGVKASWSSSKKYVTVSWKKLEIATGYDIYRKAGNGKYKKLTSTKKTIYKDKIKTLNTVYTYKVVACIGSGDDMVLTPDSKEVSAKVPAMSIPKLKIKKSGRMLRISISSFGMCSKAYVYVKVGNRKWKKLNTLKKREYLEFRMLRHKLTYQFCVKGEGTVNGKKYYSGLSKAKKYRY